MKNKKGFSVLKTIVLILFIGFLVLFIYSTFKAIADKNKHITTNETTTIKMLDNNMEYNPIDYVYNKIVLGYNYSNVNSASYAHTNLIDYVNNNNARFLSTDDYYYVYTGNTGKFPYLDYVSKFDNYKLSLSTDLMFFDNNLSYRYFYTNSYYTNSLNTTTNRSFIMCYNCDISIDAFSFNLYYNFPLSQNKNIYMFVLTDNGYERFSISIDYINKFGSFSSTELTNAFPGATKVVRFGFAFAQSSNSSNVLGYLPQYDSSISSTPTLNGVNYYDNEVYENYYRSITTTQDKNSLAYIVFSSSSYSNGYVEGYNNGYNAGLEYNQSFINDLSSQVNSLNNTLSDLRTTINQQAQIITNLQAQLDQEQTGYRDFFFTFVDIPIKTMHDILNFEFFGLNLFQFFTGVLTALGAIWLIKKFI